MSLALISNIVLALAVLACPLMMFWMMRGRRAEGRSEGGKEQREPTRAQPGAPDSNESERGP